MMKTAGKALLGGLGVTLAVGSTMLDQMDCLLTRAVQLGKEMALALKTRITASFSFLGRKTVAAGEVTVAFSRWVLERLFVALRAVAQRALNLVACRNAQRPADRPASGCGGCASDCRRISVTALRCRWLSKGISPAASRP